MAVDPSWWHHLMTEEEFDRRIADGNRKARERRKAYQTKAAIWEERRRQFASRPHEYSWAIWRRYKAGGVTLKQVGEEFGITGGSVSQHVKKCDRKIRKALSHEWNNVPDEVRNATLGVEFVFRNEVTFDDWDDMRGWDQLEPKEYGSVYWPPTPEWRTQSDEPDGRPAIPPKVYTYYKTIIHEGADNE